MTWYWYIEGSEYVVTDGSGAEISRGEIPPEGVDGRQATLDALEAETVAEYQINGFSARLLGLLRDAVFENIVEGQP